jgi:aryl-alcohol dehydrogenase-like predicted oxidoreductase
VDYSLRRESIRRDVETAQLPWCRHEHMGVIVYSPMASGLLTGAMSRERIAALPKTDWRTRNEQFKEPKLSENGRCDFKTCHFARRSNSKNSIKSSGGSILALAKSFLGCSMSVLSFSVTASRCPSDNP